jgi:hypothetical protein
VTYEDRNREEKHTRRTWTIKEQLQLEALLKKGWKPKELATRFQRTELSVRKKSRTLGYRFDA